MTIVVYSELLDAQRRADDAERAAARARRDRDRAAETLHEAGVPIRHIAHMLGLTPTAVSLRLSNRRAAAGHNETTTEGDERV